MSRAHRIPAVLLLAGVTLFGGTGVAQAQSTLPPALAGFLETGSSSGSSTTAIADAPRLTSVDNFRDVAGPGAGYATSGGGHIHKGVFYRSNAITPNDEDLATLAGLNLTVAYDLRSEEEIAEKNDRLPDGLGYMNIPIVSGDANDFLAGVHSPEDARNAMAALNRQFVTGAAERSGFAQVLTQLASTDGAQVFHCTAGKDRTGWVSHLLLSIAGVAPQTILDDYLLSNEYTAESTAARLAYVKQAAGEEIAANYAPLLSVEAGYLQAGIDQIATSYGSLNDYLTEGLGLSTETIAALRTKLVG